MENAVAATTLLNVLEKIRTTDGTDLKTTDYTD